MNEVIPLSGAFFSGVLGDSYTKTYQNITSGSALSGGFYQTVYDGSPTSISSSALIDLSYGHSSASLQAAYSETFLNNEKQRTYKEMAQLLLGNKDSRFSFGGTTYNEVFFMLFKRRIFKDEVKKGNTTISFQLTASDSINTLTLTDAGASSTYVESSAGDEASLFSGSAAIGKVYYNAGVVALASGALVPEGIALKPFWSGSSDLEQVAISGNLDNMIYGLRQRMTDVQFHNQTNLHSTLYFCRALNSDFNYSTNPTFVDTSGRIVVTSGTDSQTRVYPTTVGLYDVNDNLLAVAKTSEPIKKSPDSEVIFRIKLSY